MSPTHLLRHTPLFRDSNRIQQLSQFVSVSNFESDTLTASGTPPYANILFQLLHVQQSMEKIVPAIEENSTKIVNNVVQEFENRSVKLNTVTYTGLDELIMSGVQSVLDRNGFGVRQDETSQFEGNLQESENSNLFSYYSHPGRTGMFFLTYNYAIPCTTTPNVIHLFFFGSSTDRIRPLSRLRQMTLVIPMLVND
eukprot:NODE_222_length_12365_cov_0.759009.p3 type:complete len:196 gc:universal NODE_222_length_12365_cov_0.759009:321-908(+)